MEEIFDEIMKKVKFSHQKYGARRCVLCIIDLTGASFRPTRRQFQTYPALVSDLPGAGSLLCAEIYEKMGYLALSIRPTRRRVSYWKVPCAKHIRPAPVMVQFRRRFCSGILGMFCYEFGHACFTKVVDNEVFYLTKLE
ncbi:unnamed protein product [Cuscuta europaea]|uniref:Uncharacterized protein n=1 Tax=Cuscuta europaea TaxID=41803 RepID=A0A9P1A1L6_CUSEU|nr:unnamed protein product [Cuscuta europaea]